MFSGCYNYNAYRECHGRKQFLLMVGLPDVHFDVMEGNAKL